jgi:hypothetical protein
MKRTLITIASVVIVSSLHAAPFVTPNMVKRNGLTDEQYELLWSQGKNPRIDQSAAREWIFRASRYQNVVEWLQELGRTNDFARLAGVLSTNNVALADRVKDLVSTNATLQIAIRDVQTLADSYFSNWTNCYWQAEAESNRAARAEARLTAAKSSLTERREEYVEKRDAAKLSTTKAIYQTFIDIIDAIIAKMDEEEATDEGDSAVGE